MGKQAAEYVIGVDAGGTKTIAWLAEVNGEHQFHTLGTGSAGSANPTDSSDGEVRHAIQASIEAAFESADVIPRVVRAACLAVAGAGRQQTRLSLLRWASEAHIAEHVQVVHDAEPILYAANDEGVGVALIAGTGSLAYGRDPSGREARCGGWGHLLGDEGSGYAIAVAALRSAVRAADGRGPRTRLLTALLEQLDCPAVSDLIAAVYDTSVTRATIASLARVVFREAASGDPVAETILAEAATELAHMVRQVAQQLQLTAGSYDLAVTGGVLIHHPELRDRLVAALSQLDALPAHVTPVPDPVSGSVILAARHLRRVGRHPE